MRSPFFVLLPAFFLFMKVYRYITLFLVFGFLSLAAGANPVSKSKLTAFGQRAFKQKAEILSVSTNDIELKDVQYLGGTSDAPLLALFNFNKGFLLLAADDVAMPVLAYSFTSNLVMDQAAPGARYWIDLYQKEIQFMRDNNFDQTDEVAAEWAMLERPSTKQSRSVVVSPLITSMWNQNKYYNKYSPMDSESPAGYDNRVPNGCVAVAMSSLLYYYRYPSHGWGSHTNYTEYGNFHVNFAEQTYYYDAMEDELSFYNEEVAKLIFHCATSVDMMYSPEGSGAYSENVPDALVQYFGYAPNCSFEHKYQYSGSSWRQLLASELDANRPLYYSGYSDDGGHAFICDGYNSDNLFHFNFGWGGSSNGYYALSSNGGASNPVGGFSSGQGAIVNCYPADEQYPYSCDSRVITCSNGTLEDGSGPLDYQNNMHCEYVITEDRTYSVTVELVKFETEPGDSLSFWDGNPQNGNRLLAISGSMPQGSYTFNTDSLYIIFDTDDSLTASGWKLKYNVGRDVLPCNSGQINYQYSGDITDGSGPDNYGNNMNCFWRIRVENRPSITFSFSEFCLSPEDQLNFYNLKTSPKELLASYSGCDLPQQVTFNSNVIMITFITDNYLNGEGFTMHWTTDTASSVEDFTEESMIIYPNPSADVVNVILPHADTWDLGVMDFMGRWVNTQNIITQGDMVNISVSEWSSGIYFLVCKGNGKVLKKKFVVAH